jgi:hypothetical protein
VEQPRPRPTSKKDLVVTDVVFMGPELLVRATVAVVRGAWGVVVRLLP